MTTNGHPQHTSMASQSAIATLFPGYFALVMATGIISLAAHFLGLTHLAQVLFWVNITAYVVLWGLTLLRLVCYRAQLINDLTHHTRGVTFLTMVAGTCILGNQFAVLTPCMLVAVGLWITGLALWTVLLYTFFTTVTVREPKPSLETGINGAWLLVVVSTESLCVLGTLVAPALAVTELVLFIALAMYLLGAMLYILFITLILYRWMFISMPAETLIPTYWINMGALAITTLAGSRLLLAADTWSLLYELIPFLKGFTLFFWATGTWWIPLLVIVGIWRHVWERVPLTYDPQYWGLVFPLGMYTIATFMLAQVTGLTFLTVIASGGLYIAFVAWGITFVGMLRQLVITLRGS
jgi:tellurite resistance protein TehA-like permease